MIIYSYGAASAAAADDDDDDIIEDDINEDDIDSPQLISETFSQFLSVVENLLGTMMRHHGSYHFLSYAIYSFFLGILPG